MESKAFISICKNNDFRRIYNKGKCFVSPVLVVYVLKNRKGLVRIGITASKKIGNAVKRNRSRRIIKESVWQLFPGFKNGYDYVFVARGKTPFIKSTDVQKNIQLQLKNSNFLDVEKIKGIR